MQGYNAKDVAKMLDLSVGQVRSYARGGFLEPARGPRGEYLFSFQDLVLLRTAKGLIAARIPPRKVRSALRKLKDQLPRDRPLSGVQILADGDRVLVKDGGTVWNPESGQALLDFDVSELAQKVAPHARRAAEAAKSPGQELDADEWFALGLDLEAGAPEHARDAYRRALEKDPHFVEARVNLGRMLHEAGHVHSAEAHYRIALAARPDHAIALFNLGVSLEDLGRSDDAVRAYCSAIDADPENADAFYNLARLYERLGDSKTALRYLKAYRKLTDDR